MDGEELYDEFGNYIGPELESSSDEDDEYDQNNENGADNDDIDDRSASPLPDDTTGMDVDDVGAGAGVASGSAMNEIVLHEDKEHYPSASEVYGEDVYTNTIDEDAQALEEPIIAPDKAKNFNAASVSGRVRKSGKGGHGHAFSFRADSQFMLSTMNSAPDLNRGVAVVGHLHSGKTSLLDMLLEEACEDADFSEDGALLAHQGGGPRFTDVLAAEQERQLSIKSTPITLCLPSTRGKTYPVTLIDCPGHVNFHDESVAAMRASDGVVVVVDAVDGMMIHTEMLVSHALAEDLSITLLINKVDRLIVELKLPPSDAYYKLQHTVDSVNKYIKSKKPSHKLLTPDRGNVCFASSHHGYIFSCASFAQRYFENSTENYTDKFPKLTALEFGKRLWGDCFLDPTTRKFKRSAKSCSTKGVKRTFIEFILEPIYKLYSACLGESAKVS